MRKVVCICASLIVLCTGARAEPFRIVVLPDTQFAVQKWPELVDRMASWIVENHQPLNIKYVLHVGDIVQNGHQEQEWQRFDVCMRTLEQAKVPYILAAGNHDFDKMEGPRSLVLFNKYFPLERFKDRPSFRDSFPQHTNSNSCHTFSAGGTDWLIVSLAYNPSDEELAWAHQVVGKHPQHQVIVLTHHYLEHKGRDAPGERIWDKLVTLHPNISFVICGHLSTVHFVDKTPEGNNVYQMLFDWQNNKQPDNNSYLAVLEFDPENEKLSVKSYSPSLDHYKTGDRDQFSFADVQFLPASKSAVAGTDDQPPHEPKQPQFTPTGQYLEKDVEGWPVVVSPQLAGKPVLYQETLELLRLQLFRIIRRLPASSVEKLREIPIWVELDSGKCEGAQYHLIGTDWLADNGLNPDKAGAVEICNARNFVDWILKQPWMILHELAHGMHDRLPGRFENEEVLAAFQHAMQAKKYDHILRGNGRTVKAYAATNQMEYFSETTEAFFGTNDFFPFVRAELKAHDPLMYRVLKRVWGHSDVDNYLWQVASLPKTTPWNLTELSRPPKFDWSNENRPIRSLQFQGEPFQGKPTHAFAYYATPGTLAGNTALDVCLPAVVLVHGGGGRAFEDWVALWASRGYAAIAMDLAGRGPDGKRLDDGGPDQSDELKFGRIDAPVADQWPYHAVANVIRAHSLVRSFPEVDESRTAVTGISWGGYVTCIAAGLDRRFAAAVPVYGCGFLDEASAWLPRLKAMPQAQREKWVSLWDPSRYLGSAEMPVFFVNGTNDNFYWLDSYAKTCQLPKRDLRNLRITVGMPHSHQAGWAPQEISLFIDQHVRGAAPLPVMATPEMNDGKVTAQVMTQTELVSAQLHYTTSIEPVKDRPWQTVSAEVNEQWVRCDPPPEDANTWFLTVTDGRGATVSSEVVFVAPATPAE